MSNKGGKNFPASDSTSRLLNGLSGLMTTIATKYGSIEEMVEHPDWDEGKTDFCLSLIKAIHRNIREMDEGLSRHVKEKYG